MAIKLNNPSGVGNTRLVLGQGVDPITGLPLNAIQINGNSIDPSIMGLSGGEFSGNDLPCLRYNYHIGTPQVVKTKNVMVGADGNPLNLSQYPDHKNLTGTQCYLIAPLYECCWVQPDFSSNRLMTNGATLKGWILLARSKAAISYEECIDSNGRTGKRPVIVQYFSYEDIQNGPYTPIAGPNEPDRSVSLILTDGSRNFAWPGNGNYWGNCFGDYSSDIFLNWINSNQGLIPGITDISRYRTAGSSPNGEYLLINTTTGGGFTPQDGIVIEGDECKSLGNCVIPTVNEPDQPKNPICVEQITVNTLTQWSQYSREAGDITRTELFRMIKSVPGNDGQPTILNNGDRINLAGFGFACETGQIERYQKVFYPAFPKFTFCRLSNGSVRVTVLPNEYIIDYSNPELSGPIEDRIVESSRQFDPSCCERLSSAFLTNNSSELQALSNAGVTVGVINSSKKLELFESCGCEEIEIADLGCFYRGLTRRGHYSVILKGDIKDPRTHTGVRMPVVDERCKSDGPEVYHPFDRRRDIITNRIKSSTQGLFDNSQYMECYFTSSTKPTSSNQYYYEVTDCETCGKIPYFAVAYGHINGSGSLYVESEESNKTPSDSIYSQYQLMCLEENRTETGGVSLPKFSFVSSSTTVESDDIYVINFNRNGIKDRLDAGNFEINLAYLSGSTVPNNLHTGSNVKVGSSEIIRLIDDSDDFDEFETCDGDPLVSYNIVSGSLSNGKYENSSVNTYGKVYPNLGIVILHPKRLNEIAGFNTVTGSNLNGDNSYKIFTSISGAAAPFGSRTTNYYLTARNVKYKTTSHYFVRAYAPLFNYSNNPTFVSGSSNQIFDKCFIKEPQTYISSVGLYNSRNELLAIAKLSKPIKKTFDTDLLIKIRLNW